jgi:amidase
MAGTPTPPFNVLTTTATELETLLHEGSLTSVQIIETYLAQIEKHNHAGAKLNAMITVAPRELVLKRAGELDRERKEETIRGSFHGLHIIVKVCEERRWEAADADADEHVGLFSVRAGVGDEGYG